jgi:hypothetical protein
MALLNDYNNAQNTDFKYRVQMALVSTAIDIQAEASGTLNHTDRSAYALKVLANPVGYANFMNLGFTEDAATDLSSTDQQLKDRASSVWNAYSVQG